jgi:hypothetical protein
MFTRVIQLTGGGRLARWVVPGTTDYAKCGALVFGVQQFPTAVTDLAGSCDSTARNEFAGTWWPHSWVRGDRVGRLAEKGFVLDHLSREPG